MKCTNCGSTNTYSVGAAAWGCIVCGNLSRPATNVDSPTESPTILTAEFENGKMYLVNTTDKRLIDIDDTEKWISFRDAPYCEKCQKAMSYYYMIDSKTDQYDCKCGEAKQVSRSFRDKPKPKEKVVSADITNPFTIDDLPF